MHMCTPTCTHILCTHQHTYAHAPSVMYFSLDDMSMDYNCRLITLLYDDPYMNVYALSSYMNLCTFFVLKWCQQTIISLERMYTENH